MKVEYGNVPAPEKESCPPGLIHRGCSMNGIRAFVFSRDGGYGTDNRRLERLMFRCRNDDSGSLITLMSDVLCVCLRPVGACSHRDTIQFGSPPLYYFCLTF